MNLTAVWKMLGDFSQTHSESPGAQDRIGGVTPSPSDLVNLRWMIRCNDEYQCGYLGPTVRRFGRLPELESLIAAGLATCNDRSMWSARKPPYGYWITDAGRRSVSNGER